MTVPPWLTHIHTVRQTRKQAEIQTSFAMPGGEMSVADMIVPIHKYTVRQTCRQSEKQTSVDRLYY